jgi:hypothetical protein
MRLLDRPLPTLSRAPASWKSGVSEFVYPTQSRITDEFQGGHKLNGKISIIGCNKKYSLAGKMYEFIFERSLSQKGTLFYEAGFNRFIAAIFYYALFSKSDAIDVLLLEFQDMIRGRKGSPGTFWSTLNGSLPEPLSYIRDFCLRNQSSIAAEIEDMEDAGLGRWKLDLTSSCLFSLLCEMSDRYGCIDVYCDESKPLNDGILDNLSVMIGKKIIPRIQIGDRETSFGFNLYRQVQFAISDSSAGIQIADLASGAMYAHLTLASTVEAALTAELDRVEQILDVAIIDPAKPKVDRKSPGVHRTIRRNMSESCDATSEA